MCCAEPGLDTRQASDGLGSHTKKVSKYTGDNYEDTLQLKFLWFKWHFIHISP